MLKKLSKALLYPMSLPKYLSFDNTKYNWKPDIDYRKNPHLYKVGKG